MAIETEEVVDKTVEEISETATQAQKAGALHGVSVGEIDRNTRAGRKEIRRRRKELRKELKTRGIKSRREFENIARDVGLTLDNGKFAALLNFFWLKGQALLATGAIKLFLAGAGIALGGLFLASVITETAGSFTVNLTADMLDFGFVLTESIESEEYSSRLLTEEIEEVSNITLDDISSQVYKVDGANNGVNYMAYTFYIVNQGEEAAAYEYTLNIDSTTLGVEEAVWLMLFEDDKQVVYSKMSADGNPEELYGFRTAPFFDEAYDEEDQYYYEDGYYGLVTTPFLDDEMVMQGYIAKLEPGEFKKYTIVIWLEGNDPECTNDIFGGYAKFSLDFSSAEEEDSTSIFSGVFRTEYEDYITDQYSQD